MVEYKIVGGTIPEIKILTSLSSKFGQLPQQFKDSPHVWHSPNNDYAIGFEGEKINGRRLMVNCIYVYAEENRRKEIKEHLEKLCEGDELSLK